MSLGPFTGYGRRARTGHLVAGQDAPAAPSSMVPPPPPRKTDCPGHVAGRDELGRYPIGDCGPDCLVRAYRLGNARWDGERWTVVGQVAR